MISMGMVKERAKNNGRPLVQLAGSISGHKLCPQTKGVDMNWNDKPLIWRDEKLDLPRCW